MDKKLYIGIIGAGNCDERIDSIAEETGTLIAKYNGILVCGGMGGVMEAACRGAKKEGGTTIGILPGRNPDEGNGYLDYRIVTGFGEARNLIIVNTVDSAIAISGSYGTLSEISFCLKNSVPVISLSSWNIPGMEMVTDNPESAVETAFIKAAH
ncbi:MAG: TIGR00725 family protein [candidate division Zixibacteria bacterium]|nr:TIGR00725 family protein [candidate division Zixibacteria bacterium]